MTTQAEEYTRTSRELLVKAEEALAQDDLLQASEKGWGAAAYIVKGIAQRRGWQHSGHRELFQAVNRLVQETGDRELRSLFNVADSLHSNFYENWRPREFVQDGLERVTEFIQKLEGLP